MLCLLFWVEREQWGNNKGVYCHLSLLDKTIFFPSTGRVQDCAPFKLFTSGHANISLTSKFQTHDCAMVQLFLANSMHSFLLKSI